MELTIFQYLKSPDSEDMLTKNGAGNTLMCRTVKETEVRAQETRSGNILTCRRNDRLTIMCLCTSLRPTGHIQLQVVMGPVRTG